MSEKDPASPAVAHTSPLETPSTPNVDSLHADIENQSSEIPDLLKVDRLLCWMTIGETNFENFWVYVEEKGWEKGWEKANERLRDKVTQITTAVCILSPSLSCKLTQLFS